MNYYITGWMFNDEGEIQPNGVQNLPETAYWNCIDLRPLNKQTTTQGWCVLASDTVVPAVPGLRSLGTNLDAPLPQNVIDVVQNRFNVTLDPDTTTYRKLIKHLLTRHGTDPNDKTRWNKLEKRFGRNTVYLGNQKIIHDLDD